MTTSCEPTGGPGRALFELVRQWSRRWTGAGEGVDEDRGRDVMVTEAVLARSARGAVTINDVADELGIDPSGASRLVARAVDGGYLEKARTATDARHRVIVVTAAGHELLRAAHVWQEAVFAELTADWPAADVDRFHVLMRRLTERRVGEA